MNKGKFYATIRKDRPTAEGLYYIYIYGKLNSEKIYLSIEHAIPLKHWNESKREVKSSATNWAEINNKINLYLTKIQSYVSECDYKGQKASREEIINLVRFGFDQTTNYTDFVRDYIKKFRNEYAPKTIDGFVTHTRKVDAFRPELKMEDINHFVWRSYEAYLHEIGNGTNAIQKQSKLLKKFLNEAQKFGMIKVNRLSDLKVQKKDGNREYLTFEELRKLESLYESKSLSPFQQNTLKYFLFACYTSLRFSDVKNLCFKHIIDQETINLQLFKTKNLVNIPLNEKAKKLVDWPGLPNAKVFRVYTNQPTNRNLKQIMQKAGISKTISFHCARNTWATNTLELTGNIALVSAVLGHTTIKTTQIYAKVLNSKKKEAMKLWDAV